MRIALAIAVVLLFANPTLHAEPLHRDAVRLQAAFASAAEEFDVPAPLLASIAYVATRWTAPAAANDHADHSGAPHAWGVMGLHDDAHFGWTLQHAAALIGATPVALQTNQALNVRGAAALLHVLSGGARRDTPIGEWAPAVALFSGIPEAQLADVYVYDVFNALRTGPRAARYEVPLREVDLATIFSAASLRLMTAPRLVLSGDGGLGAAEDYEPAIWNQAASCNYLPGRSTTVTHIAEHIAQGTYAGTISWFRNCAASVSAHYVVRSSDGQVTQMVREADTGYHVGGHNSYSIGIEHEGFAENCDWYTTAMYAASALLTRDIADAHGIPRTAVYDGSLGWDTELPRESEFRIKGHTNFPTVKTCPGPCWDWVRFRGYVIGEPRVRRRSSGR